MLREWEEHTPSGYPTRQECLYRTVTEQLQWVMQFLNAQAQDSPGPVIKSIVEAYVCLVAELGKKRVSNSRPARKP